MSKTSLIANRHIIIIILTFFALNGRTQDSSGEKVFENGIEEVMNYLEDRFNVNFSYPTAILEEFSDPIRIKAKSLVGVLEELSAKTTLEHNILSADQILLRNTYEKDSMNKHEIFSLTIVDAQTKLPLELVAVNLRNTTYGVYSNSSGEVAIRVTKNETEPTLDLYMLGYEPAFVDLDYDNTELIIGLSAKSFDLTEVEVVDTKDLIQTEPLHHATILNNSDLIGSASGLGGNDIMRQVQLLAGVRADADASAGIKIRGGKEDQTLIMLDGIPIYNANHYHGVFSAINPSYVSTTSLFKNNIPIEYGGKTSGMVQIESANPSERERGTMQLDINALTASLNVQVPVSQSFGLMLGGRTSYSNASESVFSSLFNSEEREPALVQNFSNLSREDILNSVPDFRFNDINAKAVFKPSENSTLDLNLFRSEDDLSDSFTNQFNSRRTGGIVVQNREIYSNDEYWTNLGASLNYNFQLSNKLNLTGTTFYSQYKNDAQTAATLERRVRTEVQSNGAEINRLNQVEDIGLRTTLRAEINPNTTLLGGIESQYHQVDFNVNERTNDVLGLATQANETSIFIAWQQGVLQNWTINTGLRTTYYDVSKEVYFSPRAGVTRHLGTNFDLKASFSRQYQFVRELTFENLFGRSSEYWVLGGRNNIPIGTSNNYMIGFQWRKNRFEFDVEAYYRDLDGVIEFALVNPPFNDMTVSPNGQTTNNSYRLFAGDGHSRGIDLTLSYNRKSYRTYGTYTLSESLNSFRGILAGREFPSQDDRRHQFKWVNEIRFGPFGASANMVYTSGRPYTDISRLSGNLRRDELTPEQRISRLPHYARFDLGASYYFEIDGARAKFGFSVYNLLNRQNVSYLQYIFSIPTLTNQNRPVNTVIGTQTNQLNRTVNLSFTLSY